MLPRILWLLWYGRLVLGRWVSYEDEAEQQQQQHRADAERLLGEWDAHGQGLEHDHSFLVQEKRNFEPFSAAQMRSNSSTPWKVTGAEAHKIRAILEPLNTDKEDLEWKWYNHEVDLVEGWSVKGSDSMQNQDFAYQGVLAAATEKEAWATHLLLYHGMAAVLASRSDSTFGAVKLANRQLDDELSSQYMARLLTLYADSVGFKQSLMALDISSLRHLHAHDHRAHKGALLSDVYPGTVTSEVVTDPSTKATATIDYSKLQATKSPCAFLFLKEYLGVSLDTGREAVQLYEKFLKAFRDIGRAIVKEWCDEHDIELQHADWWRGFAGFLRFKIVRPSDRAGSLLQLQSKGSDSTLIYYIAGELKHEAGYTIPFAVPVDVDTYMAIFGELATDGGRDVLWSKVAEWEAQARQARGGLLLSLGPNLWASEMTTFFLKGTAEFGRQFGMTCPSAWWAELTSDKSDGDHDSFW